LIANTSFARKEESIIRALGFLDRSQLATGAFRMLRGMNAALTDASPDPSPFATPFALHALAGPLRDRPGVARMAERAARYLHSEMTPGGVWRYWSRTYWKHTRVPPDLDDTATACAALRSSGYATPRNEWVFHELRDARGRFYTWVIPRTHSSLRLRSVRWYGDLRSRTRPEPKPAIERDNPRFASPTDLIMTDDIDLVVNTNVVLYLGESPVTRGAIDWITQTLRGGVPSEFSLYYKDPLALYHAVARACAEGINSFRSSADVVLRAIRDRNPVAGEPGGSLALALAATARLTFDPNGIDGQRDVESLLAMQRESGGWDQHALYGGPDEYWGSEELTTAIALQAIALSQRA
jgi:hypothetical protein